MPQFSENKYLQLLLEDLIASYETEINYSPKEVEVDSSQISLKDINTLLNFVTEARKRLFIFKISDDQEASEKLALVARRSILNTSAKTILQNTSSEPKIYPLKKALSTGSSSGLARIQIQHSILLPQPPKVQKDTHSEQTEHVIATDIVLMPIDLPELPELSKQLKALGVEYLHDEALLKIKEHIDAFRDGIIPSNLPKGFYISKSKQALCYTDTPKKLPSALAPVLKKQQALAIPSAELTTELLSNLSQTDIALLLDTKYSIAQKNLITSLLPSYENEFKTLLQLLKPSVSATVATSQRTIEFLIPLLCKQFILGGEAHTILLIRLINACLNKKISLEFLTTPEVQNALLSARGIKNLQKLVQLPAEQKEWWNTLVTAHLQYDKNSFDFNAYFDAYTQYFLPRIAEKNLTLSNPCPIEHNGHLLITLNRVLDVIEHAENPQEQCLSLSGLNWGPTGAHYAMTQGSEPEQFKQVAACMQIANPEDTITLPEDVYNEIENEQLELKPWLFRYMGQHWNAGIRLSDIQAQLLEIEKLSWTAVQKNQLIFILTCAFSNKAQQSAEHWKKTLNSCISSLQQLDPSDRGDLLQALTRCFKFKPNPSLEQIKTLINQCIELKDAFPSKNFKTDLVAPLVSCLENEGLDLFNILQERIQKTDPTPEANTFSLIVVASFTTMLQNNRHNLFPELNKLLAKLNEPDLNQTHIDELLEALHTLQIQKGEDFYRLVLNTLSQINISKSQVLPNKAQIQTLIETLATSTESLASDFTTSEKQETWLKNLIIDKNLLSGCVIGNGDISKLDDLIVDALVDAIKKRSAAFKIDTLKQALLENLENRIVPQQLRDQLNRELIPLFDAVNDLVTLLQTPNPKFPDVIDRLKFFEEKKPILLNATYGVSILGKTKGEYILNFLLTGKKKETDHTTGALFGKTLAALHGLFTSGMTAFFDNPQNKLIVKDLDINMALSWMAAFNETHSLTFFFREELVQKKVVPALKKTLQQLNTQDPEFEQSILDEASRISETEPSDQSLQSYKDKIEAIANYLNLLIDINDKLPRQFNKIYKQLNTGALARLNYTQKQILLSKLVQEKPEDIELYLKLTTQALEENPSADNAAVERAINGLVELFKLAELETETQIMFFKMSMTHNLKSTSPFPLAALNELKKSSLPELTKSLIIKQIIQILIGLSGADSSDLIQNLLQQTQLFLTNNPDQAELCFALLKRPSQENASQDLHAYPLILQQLTQINPEHRKKIASILAGLANSKKDDTVNLFALLEISKGLGRRSCTDIDQVLKLFATLPYPNTQSLNTALLAHDSEKLRAYCESFDTNPFAKTGEKRDLSRQFATDRVKEALSSLQDLIHETDLPHSMQMKLAQQLTFIETLGYTDPLNPSDFSSLKQLTARSRDDLKTRANTLLQQLREKSIQPDQVEISYLELIAHLREIYFRTTGLFPNTTQVLVLLLALHEPSSNLLMRIKTGEGKSINAPMLSVLQWSQGGTVDQCTANPTLLARDFENSCEPFYKFLGIKTALIQSNTAPEKYQLDGINCSTVEDMSIFRLAAKEAKKEKLLENAAPIHIVLDECDDALLDQVTLYKLVAEMEPSQNAENNPAEWIYPLAYEFINLPAFRNINPAKGKIWDEDEDLEQFRLFLNKEINEKFNGNVEKQNYLMASTNTQLKRWIHASCTAATLVENKHFIVQPLKEKDEAGHEVTKKIICVPLIRSTPKTGSIFTEAVQQALLARLIAERKDQAQYFTIDAVPSVLASQSSRGLVKFYQSTKGRLLGISATPGDKKELESLATSLGTQAISVAPYAGDKRRNHPPIFTLNREESFKAIHKTLDQIKCPISKPTMEINPDAAIQTYEEHQELIAQTKRAIEKWSHSQTQPILIINEDFDEAHALGVNLQVYKEQGFKIQVITGKESPRELDRIIKQAGQVNTITVGTAMLAKGIDINTADHPKGLFVIQTYPDTERMSTQIAGRAARNGKPGEWLPIYQTKPPQNLISKLFYYILPWRRQRINERTVENLKNKIKLQATIDRLYTQAIDEVQQTLMQQIEAWESLLLEIYPNVPQIQFEFYKWREALLSELTRSQATSVSEKTLTENISQFKKLACKLWESARDEKWAAKADKATQISAAHDLRLKYLKQLDIAQELTIQTALQQKNKQFTVATKALMQQNLETMIEDKAGVVLGYTKPSDQMKQDLELAQSKQLLPKLIGEFCMVYPAAIETLIPKSSLQNAFFVPEIVTKFVNKLIEQKNKVLYNEEKQQHKESIIQYYQKELIGANSETIKELMLRIKGLLLGDDLKKLSLIEQFKMQGLILSFCTLYKNSGLSEDPKLTQLQTNYNNHIMKKLAQHLLGQFAWVNEKPEPLHSFFERGVAKEAAKAIYNLAKEVNKSPENKDRIQALYAGLQKHKIILKDKYLFSISHSSPRNAINDALNAIDSLSNAPYCDHSFRVNCHDKVVSEHQLDAFREYLLNTSPHYFKTYDPIWERLQESLIGIIEQSKDNPIHVAYELYEATERYSTYEDYKPYLVQLNALKKRLQHSIKELNQTDGIKQDVQESLFAQKEKHFAKLFNVAQDQVRIQKGSDGIHSYIELQVKDAATLKEGFTGYESSYLKRIQTERSEIEKVISAFKENKDTLLELSNKSAVEILPPVTRAEFEKLFRFKELLGLDWNNFDRARNELPELTQKRLQQLDELKAWDWTAQPVDLSLLKTNLGKELDEAFTSMIVIQSNIAMSINETQAKIVAQQERIENQKRELAELNVTIAAAQERKKQPNCRFVEKTSLTTQIFYNQGRAYHLQNQITQSEQKLHDYEEERVVFQEELRNHNQLLDGERKKFISNLIAQSKLELGTYLQNISRQHVDAREIELQATQPAIDIIEKTERDKTRYQTCRFFNTSELLRLEAQLSGEKEKISLEHELSESDFADLDDDQNNDELPILAI